MDSRLRADILQRVEGELDGINKGGYLQKVRCPSCGKREAFISSDNPWMLKCGREAKCGDQYHVKELFPDLFATWSERFGQTVEVRNGNQVTQQPPRPNAVADAYMEYGRGFDLDRIQGWYTQEAFFSQKVNAGSATVRFNLPNDGYWERLLDKPERFGKQKAYFKHGYSYKGFWWQPPAVDLTLAKEVWIVEGIFDAIALYHQGIAAVAAFTCNTYPDKSLAALRHACQQQNVPVPKLVWALDGDEAGQRYIKKWVSLSHNEGWTATAALIPPSKSGKLDWNDAYQRNELTEKHIAEYRYQGDLCIAKSANAKALLIYGKTSQQEFPYTFDNKTYWFKLNLDKFQAAMDRYMEALSEPEAREKSLAESGSVKRIANCQLQALYYQANHVTDESWYYWRVAFPSEKKPIKSTFSGGQLSSSSEFKKRLMGIAAGAIWTGSAGQLDKLLDEQISGIKTVETVDFIGYSKEHEAWIFGDHAVHKGKLSALNEEDYFDLGRIAVKSLSQSVSLSLNTDKQAFAPHVWSDALINCFGSQGVIALAFWLGSLFSEQIRQEQKSFPFLEIVGEAGSGKTTLIEFLWKLVGRSDYEGFDPLKATAAARRRTFNQVAALPTVLIESDRDSEAGAKQRQFDWDELKPLYNGRSPGSTGVKNNGNETYSAPFRSSIVISQNAQVEASEAILQRIVHMTFTRAGHSEKTRQLAGQLEKMPVEQVSNFAIAATTAEAALMDIIISRTPVYESGLSALPEIKVHRIAKNHAQMMALVDCLGPEGLQIYNQDQINSVQNTVKEIAIERQDSLSADHPVVQEFWEVFDYIEANALPGGGLNHYGPDSSEIAVNLRHIEQAAGDRRLNLPPSRELKRYLKNSKSRKFIDSNRAVRSKLAEQEKTLKCWIFKNPAGR